MEEIKSFKEAFAAWHPLLTDCWATMDSLKLFFAKVGECNHPRMLLQWLDARPLCHVHIFAFIWTGQFQLLSLTYQGWFTTVRL
jgi:hypothetical protein